VSTPATYASYLVRLWREPASDHSVADYWQGEVEHIQSGRQWRFERLPDLLAILDVHSEDDDERLWEEDV